MATMPPAAPPAMPEEPIEPMGDDAGMGDMTQGYCVELTVKSDGTFAVSGPEPIEQEAAEEDAELGAAAGEEDAEVLDNIGAALKAILDLVKANPVGESEQGNFDAGFTGETGGLGSKY